MRGVQTGLRTRIAGVGGKMGTQMTRKRPPPGLPHGAIHEQSTSVGVASRELLHRPLGT